MNYSRIVICTILFFLNYCRYCAVVSRVKGRIIIVCIFLNCRDSDGGISSNVTTVISVKLRGSSVCLLVRSLVRYYTRQCRHICILNLTFQSLSQYEGNYRDTVYFMRNLRNRQRRMRSYSSIQLDDSSFQNEESDVHRRLLYILENHGEAQFYAELENIHKVGSAT